MSKNQPSIIESIQERDPAKPTFFEVFLGYNGLHAVALHRMNQAIYKMGLKAIARMLANISRAFTGVEIHPEAQIGERLFIDHGTGTVIGQTASIGNDVTIYHGVTLGGKGKPNEFGKRHPTIMQGAVIGAGAQVLGNITIGKNARVGANAVVLKSVPDNCVVVGNPARTLPECDCDEGQAYGLPRELNDPVTKAIQQLIADVTALKKGAPSVQTSVVPDPAARAENMHPPQERAQTPSAPVAVAEDGE